MKWAFTTDRPIYAQLIEQMTFAVVSGEYRAGDKLPSVRDLAQEAAVNPNTMQKALAEMERQGMLYTQRTAGRYVTEDVAMIQQIKTKLAEQQVADFLAQMGKIGFTKDEIIALIQQS